MTNHLGIQAPPVRIARLPRVGALVSLRWGGCFGLARRLRVAAYGHDGSAFRRPMLVCTAPDGGPVGWNGMRPIASELIAPGLVEEVGDE